MSPVACVALDVSHVICYMLHVICCYVVAFVALVALVTLVALVALNVTDVTDVTHVKRL